VIYLTFDRMAARLRSRAADSGGDAPLANPM
jgi:hypothetical protein